MERHKYLENCTFVKTILMFLVIIYHAMSFWTENWFDVVVVENQRKWIGDFSLWLNSFHIYTFTLVSGFLFYYLKVECDKYKNFWNFVLTKLKRLIVPYWFVTILWVIPITQIFYKFNGYALVKKYFLAMEPSQLWFLWMLFWVFILSWKLSDVYKNKYSSVLVLFVWCIGVVGARVFPNLFCVWTGMQFIPFFWLGFKLCQYSNRIRASWICLIVVQLILYVGKIILCWNGILGVVYDLVLHMVGATAIFVILQYIAEFISWKKSKVFCFLSGRAMTIYLFHQQIIYFSIVWLNGKVIAELNVLCNCLLAVIGAILISVILFRFEITRNLVGEK